MKLFNFILICLLVCMIKFMAQDISEMKKVNKRVYGHVYSLIINDYRAGEYFKYLLWFDKDRPRPTGSEFWFTFYLDNLNPFYEEILTKENKWADFLK